MKTQHEAADLYTSLQERAATDQAQLTAERVRLAEMRATRETRRELESQQAAADAETRHAMGAVVWWLAGLGIACLALIAFLLPWAALVQWAATGDTARYLRTLLAFGALIVGGLLWRARK